MHGNLQILRCKINDKVLFFEANIFVKSFGLSETVSENKFIRA